MQEFKQWHDKENAFYREVKLYFGQCDKQKNISLSELLLLTSDTAVEDYHQRGITFDLLLENKIGLLVSRSTFRVHSPIKADDIIMIKTWEEAPKGLQLTRRYEITSKSGESLVSGNSTWLVVNTDTRRIEKPCDFKMREAPTITTEPDCLPCGKIQMPENLTVLDERTIRFTDIDANGHTNNSRYGAFIMDSLPEELQNKSYTDFRINYAHEVTQGENIKIFGFYNEQTNCMTVVGKNGDDVCFESELYY